MAKARKRGRGNPTEVQSPALKTAWWALVAMVFLVPLAMTNLTFLGFDSALTFDQFDLAKVSLLRVLSLVALAAWAWDLLRRGGKIRHTPLDWLILAFLAWATLAAVFSVHTPTAVFGKYQRYEGLLTFATYAVIYFLALQLADRPERVRTLVRALFWSSLVVAGYGLLQSAGLDPIDWGTLPFEANRAFSTYGNPNFLGAFLIFSVSIALGLALIEESPIWRLVYWAGFGVNVIALIVSFTRGAWFGGALSLVLVTFFAWRHRVRLRRVDAAPAAVIAALGVAVIWRSLSSASEVMNFGRRLGSVFQFGSGSGQTRVEIWQTAVKAIKERPLVGSGPDTFQLVFPRLKPMAYVQDAGYKSVADNAHDYPLQLAVTTGVPGALMLCAVFAWAGARSFRVAFDATRGPVGMLEAALWAGAAGYLANLLISLTVTGTGFLLWLAMGVLLAPTARIISVTAPQRGRAWTVVLLAMVALGIAAQGLVVAADHYYLTSRLEGRPSARTSAALRAVQLNRFEGDYKVEVGQAYSREVRGALDAYLEAGKAGLGNESYLREFVQRFDRAQAAYEDAIAYVPQAYNYYIGLADLYNLAGQVSEKRFYGDAIAVARKALEVEPYGPEIRLRLARALLNTGGTAEGVSELEYALRLDPAYGAAALLLSGQYERLGRPEDALAVLKAAEAESPGQPGVAEAIRRLESGSTPTP